MFHIWEIHSTLLIQALTSFCHHGIHSLGSILLISPRARVLKDTKGHTGLHGFVSGVYSFESAEI